MINWFVLVCLVGWLVILLQFWVAVLMSYPLKGIRNTNYGLKSEGNGYTTIWHKICHHLFGDRLEVFHADVLRPMAATNRMLSIIHWSTAWQMNRVLHNLQNLISNPEEQYRCFDMLLKETGFLCI